VSLLINHGNAHFVVSGNTLRVEGVVDERGLREWFEPVLADLHQRAVKAGMAEVVLDLRNLTYANAGTFASLVTWLRRAKDNEAYRVRIRTSKASRWQALEVAALRSIAPNRVISDE
jgi:hypothetical protein